MAKSADASVVVEARLSTKKFEGDVKQLEARLEQLRKKAEQPYEQNGVKITGGWNLSKEEQQEYDNISSQLDIIHQKENEILQEKFQQTRESQRQAQEQAKIAEQTTYQLSEEQKLRYQIAEMVNDYEILSSKKIVSPEDTQRLNQMKSDISQMALEYKQMTGKPLFIKGITDLNNQLPQINMNIKSVKNSIDGVVKKVGHWALAVFGVRSAYMFVRQAMSTIGQYDEQMAVNVEWIRYLLASALKPVLEYIIQLAYKLLTYINYIAQAWFGVNLFANASTKAFEKQHKAMGGTVKQAKELKKTLAGFDEMNILQKDGSVAQGGGGGGVSLPSADLMDMSNVPIPEWIDWIAKNKDTVITALAAIAAGIIAIKTAGLSLMGLGIGIAIAGIILLVKNILDFLENPTWDGFLKIMYSLELAIAGVALAMIAFNATNPVGWIILAVDAIAFFVTALLDWVTHLNESRDSIKNVEQATNDLNEAQLALANQEYNNIKAIEEEETAIKKLEEMEKQYHISAQDLLKIMEEEHKTYKDLTPEQRAVYEAYIQLQKAQGKVKTTADAVTEAKKEEVKQSLETELANAKEANSYDLVKQKAMEAFQQGYISAEEASQYISRAMANMDYDTMKVFVEDIPDSIKKGLDPYQYKSKMDNMRAWWNGELKKFNDEISLKINTDNLKGGVVMSLAYDRREMAKGGIYIPPKLAVGGVINQPGRGIPLGSAIGGEAGAEGVIPLTDSQQMELLGETIGRYISINLTNITELDGRQIARKVDKVRNNTNFVMNR